MKTIIGIVLILVGIVLGLYVGLWIVQILNAVKAPEVVATTIAWGIIKIVFASFLGWISAMILIVPGCALITE